MAVLKRLALAVSALLGIGGGAHINARIKW